MTERDRKILMLVIPLVLVVAYWFLLLSPKRDEATKAGEELTKQEQRLDDAKAQADAAKGAETNFESDFTEVVRLGKAIPASVDMPSLIVQLDRAAAGTGIHFTKIATGDRQSTGAVPAASPESAPSGGSSTSGPTPAAEAGGQAAQSAPGTAVESANDAQATANQQAAAAEQSGVSQSDTQTSTSAEGGLAVGGGTATPATNATGATTTGLETVPLELEFVGDFFNLADFFHDVKRFVRVANQNILVGGRLVTFETVRWSSDPELFPRLKAELTATIYLSPRAEGATAGATPAGPTTDQTTPAGTATASNGGSPVPTATATP
jgi:Tfp pilus assembly protein PilO